MAERSPRPSRPPPCKIFKMSGRDFETMMAALRPTVEDLNLSGMDLGNQVTPLCSFLQRGQCRLKSLKMANCNLSRRSCEELVRALSGSFKSSDLKELDLSGNDLQDSGAEMLSAFLKSNDCELETLRLSQCGLTDTSCAYLASALKSNPFYLKELDLRGNDLSVGAKRLSDLLNKPPHALETLRWGPE